MDQKSAKITTALISKHFGVQQNDLQVDFSEDIYEQFLNGLERIVAYMLEKDMNRLLSGLYIIDVDETEFQKVLTSSEPSMVARNVAKLILDRELKKVEFRKKYGTGEI